jgi:hypothetical protein
MMTSGVIAGMQQPNNPARHMFLTALGPGGLYLYERQAGGFSPATAKQPASRSAFLVTPPDSTPAAAAPAAEAASASQADHTIETGKDQLSRSPTDEARIRFPGARRRRRRRWRGNR